MRSWRKLRCCPVLQVAPNYPIVRNNLAVALTDLGTTLKVRGQLKTGVLSESGSYSLCVMLHFHHAVVSVHLGQLVSVLSLDAHFGLQLVRRLATARALAVCACAFPIDCVSAFAGIACYERALALMPRHADALYNLGVACAEDGQTERALFCYELTTHFNPNCAEAWNNLGVLHKEADNLERAAECYMAALNIRPNFPQVRRVQRLASLQMLTVLCACCR